MFDVVTEVHDLEWHKRWFSMTFRDKPHEEPVWGDDGIIGWTLRFIFCDNTYQVSRNTLLECYQEVHKIAGWQ